jgi:hypothetical protein
VLPSREALIAVVQEWMAGERSTRSVHEWAEALQFSHVYSPDFTPDHPPADPIAGEVLLRLSFLNVELITAEDGPAILAFLGAPSEKETEAWVAWRAYWDRLDLQKRKETLEKDAPGYYYT